MNSAPWISLWAAPAAIGFALFFNVRRRTLIPIAILAALAHLLRSTLQDSGVGIVGASLAAAFLVGAIAYLLGPATGEASPVYAFAPVIPLVPGSMLFDGLEAFGRLIGGDAVGEEALQLLATGSQDVLTASTVVLALAFGSTAPGLFRIAARSN